MLLLANDLPVSMDVLGTHDGILASLNVTLRHLDNERATVTLEPGKRLTCLHWGSRVRFWIGDGVQNYEVTGTVIAHEALQIPISETDLPEQELLLRLWECRPVHQQRTLLRRKTRVAVKWRPVVFQTSDAGPEVDHGTYWRKGWTIDIGGAGMRLRVPHIEESVRQVDVQFHLPEADTMGNRHSFQLRGKVIRLEKAGRRLEAIDVALKYVLLSAEDGLALSAFLTGQ